MECAFAGCKAKSVKAVRVLDLETRESEVLGLCKRHSRNRLRVAGCRVTVVDPRLSRTAVGK
jgi:hypothetical protein